MLPLIAFAQQEPEERDAIKARKRFLTYLERHNTPYAHDTLDYTYSSYWGPDVYVPYQVRVGHLLNARQLHAVMYYNDALGAGLQVFLWKDGRWRRIYRNDSIETGNRTTLPILEDWNGDGIKDIVIGCRDSPSSNEWLYGNLWVTDTSGEKMHLVDHFEDIRYPQLNKKTFRISSTLTHNFYYTHSEHAIKGYKLHSLDGFAIMVRDNAKVRDSAYEVEWRRNGKVIRRVYASPERVDSYVPAHLKKDVDRWSH